MKERLIVGLDIGTSHIRIAAGSVSLNHEKQLQLNILGAAEVQSAGVAKGAVVALDDAVSSITSCLEQAERAVGLPFSEAIVGIGGVAIGCQEAKGVIGVSRTDGEIRAEDVTRAIDSARAYINPANQEIVHVQPRGFSVDGQHGIRDPVGMQGIRLEVDTLIIHGLSAHVRNVTQAVFRTNVDVNMMVYGIMACAAIVTTARQRELGVCVVNIGASTTSIAVYENGDLMKAVTVAIGADNITNDIAIVLRVSLDAAERIKCEFGCANPEMLPKRAHPIELVSYGGGVDETVTDRHISEIIHARVEEIYSKVESELKKIDREGLLPAGIVITGGGAKLPGMVEVGKECLRLPCEVGHSSLTSSMPEMTQDPNFSVAVGLVAWGYESLKNDNMYASAGSGKGKKNGFLKKIGSPIRNLFKSFAP